MKLKKPMLNTMLMRGGNTSHTIMSGYYKYFSASLENNASARNFVLEANETQDKKTIEVNEVHIRLQPNPK